RRGPGQPVRDDRGLPGQGRVPEDPADPAADAGVCPDRFPRRAAGVERRAVDRLGRLRRLPGRGYLPDPCRYLICYNLAMDAENGQVARPIDIYARVSRLKRDEKREPSTEGQVTVCRARLVDLGLPEGKVLIDPG